MSRENYSKLDIIEIYLNEEKSRILLRPKDSKKSLYLPFECTFITYDDETDELHYCVHGHPIRQLMLNDIDWIKDLASGVRSTEPPNNLKTITVK